ncbi:MAG TPA: HEAT repeat domain-containing protein, partial [Candidatus Polarisedimenticolia bacterium]|nr:HEAT repeat domain-containing protein [Candidatus Polarisedimenticolia bacterium]
MTFPSLLLLAALAAPPAGASSGPDRDPAFASILELEDRRTAGGGALASWLSPQQPEDVRERAALAAGRIGAPAASPYLLLDLLRHRSAALRRAAVFALGEMDDPRGGPLAAAALSDPDAGVRALAAEALGKLKDPSSVERLTALLGDRDEEAAGSALLALWKIDPGPLLGRQISSASAIAASGRGELRRRAVYFLMRALMARPGDAAAEEALARAAGDPDALTRSWAARGLGASSTARATGALLDLAADGDWRVRVNAFNGLRARPVEPSLPGGGPAWPIYEAALRDPRSGVRLAALGALESLRDERAREGLARALSDPHPRWREVAAGALAAREKEASAGLLTPLAGDPVWSVRAR